MAEVLAGWIVVAISAIGYAGSLPPLAIESAWGPPSEVIMPFAGYLVSIGRLNPWFATLTGTVGCNVGSIPPCEIGRRGGRVAVRRYDRCLLPCERNVDRISDDRPARRR